MSDALMRLEDKRAQNKMAPHFGMEKPYPEHELSQLEVEAIDEVSRQEQVREEKIDELIDRLNSLRVNSEPQTGQKIARAVAKAHGINWAEFLSRRRHRPLVKARQHAMWEMHKGANLSYCAIARILGGLDHTTIIHGVKSHQRRLDNGEYPELGSSR